MAKTKTPQYAWAVAIAGLFLGIASISGSMCWGYVSPYIAEQFGLLVTDIAIGASLYNLLCGFLGFLVGILGDRFGARLLTSIACFGMGICYILAGFFDSSSWGPVIFYGASGFFAAFIAAILLPKVIAEWFSADMRGKGMLLNVLGGTITGALMGIVCPAIILTFGWQGVFQCLGGAQIVCGIICFTLIRDTPESVGTHALGISDAEAEAARLAKPVLTDEQIAAQKKESRANTIKVLKLPQLWIFAVSLILWFFMYLGIAVFQTSAILGAGFDITVAGGISTAVMLANLIGLFTWSPLSDKILSRNLFFSLMLFGAAIMFIIIYFVLKSGITNVILLFALFVVLGLINITAPIQQNLYAEVFPPSLRNVGPGVLLTLGTIGSTLAPIVAAQWIAGFGGDVVSVFIFTAISAALSGIIALFLPKTGGKYGDPLADEELGASPVENA